MMGNAKNFPYLLDLESSIDERGSIHFSNETNFPFTPVRFFFIDPSSKDSVRGGHGHHECWQLFFPVKNKIIVSITNRYLSTEFQVAVGQVLVVPPKNWCEIRFTDKNTTLVVLASQAYDESDYFYDKDFYLLN